MMKIYINIILCDINSVFIKISQPIFGKLVYFISTKLFTYYYTTKKKNSYYKKVIL